MYGISQFNMINPTDKIGINIINDHTLKVMIGQGGSWFWRKGVGLTDYENSHFKITLKGWYFMLDIKNPHPGTIYIYPEGGQWKEVDFDKNK